MGRSAAARQPRAVVVAVSQPKGAAGDHNREEQIAALKAERARLRELVKREKRKRARLLARAAKLSRADLLHLAANASDA